MMSKCASPHVFPTQDCHFDFQLSNLNLLAVNFEFFELRLKVQLQTRTHLEQQKADLTANNNAFTREIKVSYKVSRGLTIADFFFTLNI